MSNTYVTLFLGIYILLPFHSKALYVLLVNLCRHWIIEFWVNSTALSSRIYLWNKQLSYVMGIERKLNDLLSNHKFIIAKH